MKSRRDLSRMDDRALRAHILETVDLLAAKVRIGLGGESEETLFAAQGKAKRLIQELSILLHRLRRRT